MDEGAYAGFDVERRAGGIGWVRLARPERLNAMNVAMKRDLVEALVQAQLDDRVRVLVFTGAGRAFCAGDDLAGYRDAAATRVPAVPAGHHSPLGTYDGLRSLSQAVIRAVRDLDKVTIAAVNGPAIQSGFSLALACDLRLAAHRATMGSATLRFGLMPDEGGHWLLVQQLGTARAMEFLLRKRIVRADEALAFGLVHEVCDDASLEERAMALATEIADGPQVATRLLKRAVQNAAELTFAQACEDIATKTAISDAHPDADEGARAFREKRAPRFNADLP